MKKKKKNNESFKVIEWMKNKMQKQQKEEANEMEQDGNKNIYFISYKRVLSVEQSINN